MLKYIDVFLGVALVMLGVSLIITIVTQMVSFIFNFRGQRLRNGLAELLTTLPGGFSDNATATVVANAILRHKLIADGLGKTRLVQAISRIDLGNLLTTPGLLATALSKEASDRLAGIAADIDRWFDATMSRVSNRFAMQTRVVTIVASALMAFTLQLDVFGLTKQLYADSDLRASLVGATGAMLSNAERVLATAPAADKAAPSMKAMVDQIAGLKRDLESAGTFHLVPSPYAPWRFDSIWVFLGVVASAALLSLGAPFWFNLLKTASNLRPAIAAQVDNRKKVSPPVDPAAAGSSPG